MPVHHLKLILHQVIRIFLELGHNFAALDGQGNIPVRAEHQVGHVLREDRGVRSIRPAHHHAHGQFDGFPLAEAAQDELRNIDQDGGRVNTRVAPIASAPG